MVVLVVYGHNILGLGHTQLTRMGLITGWTRDLGLHMCVWLVQDSVIVVIISETCPAVVICSKVISSIL